MGGSRQGNDAGLFTSIQGGNGVTVRIMEALRTEIQASFFFSAAAMDLGRKCETSPP